MTLKRISVRQGTAERSRSQRITLGGVRLTAKFQYVAATERWVMTLSDLSGVVILAGVTVVPGVDLLLPFKHLALPQGQLFVISKDREPPTLLTVDRTAHVNYREAT
jgi:hypothetical protein